MPSEPLTVIGIDDWAFQRNHRYGTLVCDLKRRRVVSLLPDRETATVQARLAEHPGISILARDRGGGYGEAAAQALPDAEQVADRWHLMENATSVSATQSANPYGRSQHPRRGHDRSEAALRGGTAAM